MSNHILFVFEGRTTEPNITNSLRRFFIQETGNTILSASYGFNIYKLYQELNKDDDLELLELLKIQIRKRQYISDTDQEILDISDSDMISDIYLFFDYDCHCGNASDDKLSKMLSIFNDSMDKGLLCISYPMVESIKHAFISCTSQVTYSTSALLEYKSFVNRQCNSDIRYQNWGLYDLDTWKEIISINLHRAFELVSGSNNLPENPIEQKNIFDAQLNKHIPHNEVAVISAFPLMLHEYYGSKLIEQLES